MPLLCSGFLLKGIFPHAMKTTPGPVAAGPMRKRDLPG